MTNFYVFYVFTMFWIKGISSTELLTVIDVIIGSTVDLVCVRIIYEEYAEQLVEAETHRSYLKSKGDSNVTISR